MIKTGLFFGSFNPIHIGHLAVANYMIEFENLDEVRFVVSPQNPFKKKDDLLDASLRLQMATIATKHHPAIHTENIELELPAPSYTSNTLKALQTKYPNHEFSIIMGADNLQNIHKWKDAAFILENFSILIYPRPGFKIDTNEYPTNCKITEAPMIDISSTQLRNWIANNKEIPYFTTPEVQNFIHYHKLYI